MYQCLHAGRKLWQSTHRHQQVCLRPKTNLLVSVSALSEFRNWQTECFPPTNEYLGIFFNCKIRKITSFSTWKREEMRKSHVPTWEHWREKGFKVAEAPIFKDWHQDWIWKIVPSVQLTSLDAKNLRQDKHWLMPERRVKTMEKERRESGEWRKRGKCTRSSTEQVRLRENLQHCKAKK